MRTFATVVAVALALTGCGMRTLKKNLQIAHEQASIEGSAAIAGGGSAPIVVVLEQADTGKIADLFVLARPGPFYFTVPAGHYRLGAFEDRSRDLTYRPDSDPAVLLGGTGEIVLQEGERRRNVALTIDPAGGVALPFAVQATSPDERIGKIPAMHIGTITTLDDPRFAAKYGSLGL